MNRVPTQEVVPPQEVAAPRPPPAAYQAAPPVYPVAQPPVYQVVQPMYSVVPPEYAVMQQAYPGMPPGYPPTPAGGYAMAQPLAYAGAPPGYPATPPQGYAAAQPMQQFPSYGRRPSTPPTTVLRPKPADPPLWRFAPDPRPLHPSLGAGVVDVPPVAYRDPLSALIPDPVVAEEMRFCASCASPIGRGSAISRGPNEGQCYACGSPFSFTPPLRPGDVVGTQYQVYGCLSYGGQGWIYLAKDHNVSNRWVVLKGVIQAGSQAAAAAALNEQRFLAEVQHPNIVQIYNFVWHEPTRTSYIVMEYLGGPTLEEVAYAYYNASGGRESLPVGQVIAYGLEMLRTLSYLHGLGLLFCDLKPSNVIQVRDRIKLIDLGGVRWQNDNVTPMIHTDGFTAPELATRGASISSDLYSLARTLAALSLDFDSSGRLPVAQRDTRMATSYLQVLNWATHVDPAQRPRNADEMADYLAAALYA